MKKLAAAVLLAATSASAEQPVISIENCDLQKDWQSVMECDVTNHSQTAVASFRHDVLITQPDRVVPWVDLRDGPPRSVSVSGGIEPGETVRILMRGDHVSDRADMDNLVIEVNPLGAFDVNGDPID